jgi:hypothetical protein
MTRIESREIIGYYAAAALVFALLALGLLILRPFEADAHDRGQFAQSSPEIRQWFNGLHSGKGPCCSNSDGVTVDDPDWRSQDGRYQVRLNDEWVDVPDDALITEPNRIGRTMVWPMFRDGKMVPRCFMPGSMT